MNRKVSQTDTETTISWRSVIESESQPLYLLYHHSQVALQEYVWEKSNAYQYEYNSSLSLQKFCFEMYKEIKEVSIFYFTTTGSASAFQAFLRLIHAFLLSYIRKLWQTTPIYLLFFRVLLHINDCLTASDPVLLSNFTLTSYSHGYMTPQAIFLFYCFTWHVTIIFTLPSSIITSKYSRLRQCKASPVSPRCAGGWCGRQRRECWLGQEGQGLLAGRWLRPIHSQHAISLSLSLSLWSVKDFTNCWLTLCWFLFPIY